MKATFVLLLLVVLFPAASRSQSPFDGTWVIDTNKDRNFAAEKPIAFSLADGMFRDDDRVVKTDGKDQKVAPTGYWDSISVRIVDDRTVELQDLQKGGETNVHGNKHCFSGRQHLDPSGERYDRSGGGYL